MMTVARSVKKTPHVLCSSKFRNVTTPSPNLLLSSHVISLRLAFQLSRLVTVFTRNLFEVGVPTLKTVDKHNLITSTYRCMQLSDIQFLIYEIHILMGGTRWPSWLRHCATSRKVAGSIPDEVTGIFQ